MPAVVLQMRSPYAHFTTRLSNLRSPDDGSTRADTTLPVPSYSTMTDTNSLSTASEDAENATTMPAVEGCSQIFAASGGGSGNRGASEAALGDASEGLRVHVDSADAMHAAADNRPPRHHACILGSRVNPRRETVTLASRIVDEHERMRMTLVRRMRLARDLAP